MDDILKLLDQVEVLPPSPSLLPRLLPALADVDSNFDEVVDMIALDPSLTAKLLQICNSAFFGTATPVTNVRDAVSQAGYQAIYLLAAMISGGECFQFPASASLDSKRLWKHSVTAAYGSKFVAESAGIEGGLLFTAGLLHDIGKVVLVRAHGEAYGLLRLRAMQTSTPPVEAEIESYGFSHADVGAGLLEKWKLPAPLVAGVRFHHHPSGAGEAQRIAACACLGNVLAHSQEQPAVTGQPDFKNALTLLNLLPDEVDRWQERIREHRGLMEMMCRLPA